MSKLPQNESLISYKFKREWKRRRQNEDISPEKFCKRKQRRGAVEGPCPYSLQSSTIASCHTRFTSFIHYLPGPCRYLSFHLYHTSSLRICNQSIWYRSAKRYLVILIKKSNKQRH